MPVKICTYIWAKYEFLTLTNSFVITASLMGVVHFIHTSILRMLYFAHSELNNYKTLPVFDVLFIRLALAQYPGHNRGQEHAPCTDCNSDMFLQVDTYSSVQ